MSLSGICVLALSSIATRSVTLSCSFDEISFVLGFRWRGLPSSVCVGGISLDLGVTLT